MQCKKNTNNSIFIFVIIMTVLTGCSFFEAPQPYRINPLDDSSVFYDFRPVAIGDSDFLLTWKGSSERNGNLQFYVNFLDINNNLLLTEKAIKINNGDNRTHILHTIDTIPPETRDGYYSVYLVEDRNGENQKYFLDIASPVTNVIYDSLILPIVNLYPAQSYSQESQSDLISMGYEDILCLDFSLQDISIGTINSADLSLAIRSGTDCSFRIFAVDEHPFENGTEINYFTVNGNAYRSINVSYTSGTGFIDISLETLMEEHTAYVDHIDDYDYNPGKYFFLQIESPDTASLEIENSAAAPISLDISYLGYNSVYDKYSTDNQ